MQPARTLSSFPAWKKALGAHAVEEMGDKFETSKSSSSAAMALIWRCSQIAEIEQTLGLADLAQFTPPRSPTASASWPSRHVLNYPQPRHFSGSRGFRCTREACHISVMEPSSSCSGPLRHGPRAKLRARIHRGIEGNENGESCADERRRRHRDDGGRAGRQSADDKTISAADHPLVLAQNFVPELHHEQRRTGGAAPGAGRRPGRRRGPRQFRPHPPFHPGTGLQFGGVGVRQWPRHLRLGRWPLHPRHPRPLPGRLCRLLAGLARIAAGFAGPTDLCSGSVMRRAYFGIEGKAYNDFQYEIRFNAGGSDGGSMPPAPTRPSPTP